MDIIKGVEGNRILKEKIISGLPFIASKIGAVEKDTLGSKVFLGGYSDRIRYFASNNAGITPADDDTLDFFCESYSNALGNVNMLGSMESNLEVELINRFAPKDVIFSELRYLEPFYYKNPWSEALLGLNVLVVHPFVDSIVNQYSKRELLFENKRILPRFNLLTLKAEQTNGGGREGNKSFKDSLNLMIDKIHKIDYDIAILGCGAYGLLLSDVIKNSGRQAVHIGGGSQIMFGIKGRRWDVHPEISAMFNKHWVRPLEEEKTRNIEVIEGGTYW
jgi:hypothetical protein